MLAKAGIAEDVSYYRQFTSKHEKAALTVAMRIQAAWKANDAARFARTFTENGSLLMRDTQLTSRAEIRAFMAAGFAGAFKGAHVKGWPIAVRFPAEDIAIVVTEGGIVMPGETDIADRNFIRATWVIVKRDRARLQLLSHHSSPIRG